MLACCGLAEHELTGAQTYYGLTPRDTRKTATDALTQGWFTGLIPITVPIADSSFEDAARAAQLSFDTEVQLAEVPYERVIELAPTVGMPRPNFPVINFLDAGTAPLSVLLTAELDGLRYRRLQRRSLLVPDVDLRDTRRAGNRGDGDVPGQSGGAGIGGTLPGRVEVRFRARRREWPLAECRMTQCNARV